MTTMQIDNRILSLSMRPQRLEDLVGQDENVSRILYQFKSRRIPHFYLLSGNVGQGKTTFARILALLLHKYATAPIGTPYTSLNAEDWKKFKSFDINEINAANKTSIDDVRQLLSTIQYKPITGSKVKVIILDEAHQLSIAAQNALLTPTEDAFKHVYFIFCSSQPGKIIEALTSRSTSLIPTPLTDEGIKTLLVQAAQRARFTGSVDSLVQSLIEHSITSPRLILQAAEKFFAGVPPLQCLFLGDTSDANVRSIGACVLNGSWEKCSTHCRKLVKNDVISVRCYVLGCLKSELLRSSGAKAVNISKAIDYISRASDGDTVALPSLIASLCIACEYLKSTVKPASSKTK